MAMTELPRAGAISKPHDYKQNVQKRRAFWKNEFQRGSSLKISDKKNQKLNSFHGEQIKRTTRPQGQKLKMNPCKQEEKNWSKIEKIIQNKAVGTLQE